VSELGKALLQFQKNAPDLHRDATNPHFKSKFLSLEGLMGAVLPVANNCGLVISQFPTTADGTQPALRTRIEHADSGEFIEDVMLLVPEKEGPQAQGSALTYARRYSLMAALGLVADEDDDGNQASNGRQANGVGTNWRPSEAKPDMSQEEYLALVEIAQLPKAVASQQVIHFGKNKGVLLSELTPGQLRWLANEWVIQDEPSEYDHRLKAAAVALQAGDDRAIGSDVALGTPIA